jgi:hypothetical protein
MCVGGSSPPPPDRKTLYSIYQLELSHALVINLKAQPTIDWRNWQRAERALRRIRRP